MQIKTQGKSILIANLKYHNVYLIDIDENRIELNDINHMVIGTTNIEDFAVVDSDAQPINHIETIFNFKNGATIITDKGDFYDIFQIKKNALVYQLISSTGEIDGEITHFGNIKVDVAEYDKNRHLTGDVYQLE